MEADGAARKRVINKRESRRGRHPAGKLQRRTDMSKITEGGGIG